MSASRILSIIAGSAVALALSVSASEPQAKKQPIPEPLKEYYYSGMAPDQLAYAVDVWYDAVLKGDQPRIALTEQSMLALLQRDLDSTTYVVDQFRQLLWQAQVASVVLPDTGQSLSDDLPVLELLDREHFSYALDICKTKERLVTAIRRSDAISNKYRLISDYIEVLRRQVGLPKLKLAGNPSAVNAQTKKPGAPVDVQVSEGDIKDPLQN